MSSVAVSVIIPKMANRKQDPQLGCGHLFAMQLSREAADERASIRSQCALAKFVSGEVN